MTNQMPERIFLIQNPDMEVDEDSHIIWSTSPDIYEQQQVVGEYIRADLAQKTVTREELEDMWQKAYEGSRNSRHMGGEPSFKTLITNALISANLVKVSD